MSDDKQRKSRIRYSKALIKFICGKIAEGNDLKEVCKKYPKQCPPPQSVSRWKRKYPEIVPMFNEAYKEFLFRMTEELNYISKADPRELYPETDDFRERSERRRARIDGLKFMIDKVGKVISPEKPASIKLEHSGQITGPAPVTVIPVLN